MLNPDEIIEIGFANLRREVSSRGLAELSAQGRRRASAARIKTAAAGLAGCVAITGIVVIGISPVSALAALRESARLSGSQPIVHFHIVNRDTYEHPSDPPARQDLPIDIWRFPDRYIRRQGHVVKELFRDGRYLAYDDRFPDGFSWRYDAKSDPAWTHDGTIGPEIARRLPSAVKVETRRTERGDESVYEWSNLDAHQNGIVEHVYVNQRTHLIAFAEGDLKEPDGRKNHGTCTSDYPDAREAEREAGGFPSGLRFRTKSELIDDFNRQIVVPEQTKTLGGVRVSLYGAIVYPNLPDGIGVEAILRGYDGHDSGPGHPMQIANAPIFAKRSSMSLADRDPARANFTRVRAFNHLLFTRAESNDLLARAPRRLTLRVPVWRPLVGADHGAAKSGQFVGYLTFTTSKLFYNVGTDYLPYYGDPGPGR